MPKLGEASLGHLFRTGAASGALSGVVGQYVGDGIAGRRSNIGDYAGAAFGGGLGGLSHPFVGAGGSGAIAGGAAPAAQALFNGRVPSPQDIYSGALTGFGAGRWTGKVAAGQSNGLPIATKGRLGENLSAFDSRLLGETPIGQQVRTPLSNYNGRSGYTVVDLVTKRGDDIARIESKFGDDADLSLRQRQAVSEGLPGYRVQRWTPQDMGGMAGAGAASFFHRTDDPWAWIAFR